MQTPSGLVIEYGDTDAGKPLTPSGVPRVWLATQAHDGRGNAMTYTYCFEPGAGGASGSGGSGGAGGAGAGGEAYTAEYALDEITYTSFNGSPSVAPSRAVAFVYGTKDAG